MAGEEFAPAIALAVNVDVTARRDAERRGVRLVALVGIGDAQREVKGALRIARIDRVGTFGCAAIAFALLVTLGRKAQATR